MDLLHSLKLECSKSVRLKKGRYVYQKGLVLATLLASILLLKIPTVLSFKGLRELVSPV